MNDLDGVSLAIGILIGAAIAITWLEVWAWLDRRAAAVVDAHVSAALDVADDRPDYEGNVDFFDAQGRWR